MHLMYLISGQFKMGGGIIRSRHERKMVSMVTMRDYSLFHTIFQPAIADQILSFSNTCRNLPIFSPPADVSTNISRFAHRLCSTFGGSD